MFQWNGSDTLPSPWASARVRVAPSTWTPARVEAEAPVRAPPIRFSGPLTFLGYQLLSPTENRLELTTVWQAEAAHSRPLALTARVTRADSLPLASSEGPGVPANQWQAGDILVQRHQWETPDGLRPGPYWIQVGVYWRDTQESWQALVDGSAAGDQLLLPSEAERP
jgi:hypothetical protein